MAAGVRRIEALTREGARRYLSRQAEIAREAAAALKTNPAELAARVAQLSKNAAGWNANWPMRARRWRSLARRVATMAIR